MIESSENYQSSGADGRAVSVAAAEWIQRRHFWDWSENDQAEFDAWLSSDPLNLVTYLRVESAWKRTERLAALGPTAPALSPTAERKPHWPALSRIAIALIVVGVSVSAAWYAVQPKEITYVTPIGVHETITLTDGSQVELNTDSVMRTRADADRRMIMLDKGEAFFRIKHDAANPFIVLAGGQRVTDLGTKFLIRETDDKVEVAVLEGSAKLESADAHSAVLKAGDVAMVATHSIAITRKSGQDLANAVAWRQGMLVFSQTPLADVAGELNRYNAKKLIIADSNIAKDKIGGTFPTNGVNEVVAAARLLFGLRIEDRGSEIVISR